MRTTINVVTAPAPVDDAEQTPEPTGSEKQDEAPRRARKARSAGEGESK